MSQPARISEAPEKVPVFILTGFLGAGKTTLLNRMLTAPHGRRIAVVINEFGEVGIDHHLVVASEEEILQMNNGCICCTVQGDLLRVLLRLLERRGAFDYLVVETSGLADPTVLVQTLLLDERVRRDFELRAVVTVVDGMHIEQQLAAHHEAREQVACADALLLNKTDLITPEEADSLADRLADLNPAARVTPTRNAEVDMGELLEMRAFDLEAKRRAVQDCDHREHHPSVQTVSFVQPGDLDKARLSRWFRSVLAERGPDLLRMKGILHMYGDSHQFVFHGVHSMFEGRLGREWEDGEERLNRLVFIGRDLDGDELQRGLRGCLRSGDEAPTDGEPDIYREVSPFTLDQILIWVRQALEFPSRTPVTIKEVPCVKPGCPPIETAIMVFLEAEPPRFYKIQKTINEVNFDSVYNLIENPMPCC